MGNDGGSIPKRRELVKEAARNPTSSQIKESLATAQEYAWTTDPLTRKPLAPPIVSDEKGRLYNKEAILEHLLEQTGGDEVAHITSLKDVVEVHLTPATDKSGSWICPISSAALGSNTKASYIVKCGHVISSSALKEMQTPDSNESTCPVCDTVYATEDVIPILPTDKDDIARLATRAKTLRESGLAHSGKKAGKKEKKAKKEGDKKRPRDEADEQINNAGTKALTAAVLAEQERKKKAKRENENLASLFSSRDQSKPLGKSADFMTRGYEIPAHARR